MLRIATALLVAAASPVLAEPYVVCDNGLRCVMPPCPSSNALDLTTGKVARITGIDTDRLSPRERDRIFDADGIYHGSLVLDGMIQSRRVKSGSATRPATVLVVRGIERRSGWNERRMCRAGR